MICTSAVCSVEFAVSGLNMSQQGKQLRRHGHSIQTQKRSSVKLRSSSASHDCLLRQDGWHSADVFNSRLWMPTGSRTSEVEKSSA